VSFDLAIVAAVLAAQGIFHTDELHRTALLGELGLDGRLRPVRGILPELTVHDSLEVSAVHSLAGFNLADQLITRAPYSDPHHSASVASIVGGGQRMAKSGAISCAHARV
jgi:magnesium chelatase family protein